MSSEMHITRDKWDEWDEIRMLALKKIKEIGHDITITLDENSPQHEKERPKRTSARKREIICLDTGEVYESMQAAADAAGAKSSVAIRRVCTGERSQYRGKHYAYYDDYLAGTIPKYYGAYEKEPCEALWR